MWFLNKLEDYSWVETPLKTLNSTFKITSREPVNFGLFAIGNIVS